MSGRCGLRCPPRPPRPPRFDRAKQGTTSITEEEKPNAAVGEAALSLLSRKRVPGPAQGGANCGLFEVLSSSAPPMPAPPTPRSLSWCEDPHVETKDGFPHFGSSGGDRK